MTLIEWGKDTTNKPTVVVSEREDRDLSYSSGTEERQ